MVFPMIFVGLLSVTTSGWTTSDTAKRDSKKGKVGCPRDIDIYSFYSMRHSLDGVTEEGGDNRGDRN